MAQPRDDKFVPDVELTATNGQKFNLRRRAGLAVLFVYPYTGRPGVVDPPGWDMIPGAHGSTPQALGYSELHGEFEALNVAVFGMSLQDSAWQQEFVQRCNLKFELLSDSRAEFANKMPLEMFSTGGMPFLRRRTFVLQDGQVIRDQRIIPDPGRDAAETLAWLVNR